MGLFVMIAVTLVVFFILKAVLGTLAAVTLSVALLVGWFIFNIRSNTTGLIKANMFAYFFPRSRGATHEEALENVMWSRYRSSSEKQMAVKYMFERSLFSEYQGVSSDQFDESEMVKTLVYVIFCYEQGTPPTPDKILRIIDSVYDSMRPRYGVRCDMRNIENVRRYRKDISEALGVEFKEEDMDTDYFLGRFMGEQWDCLDSLGLINRGFCPLCGGESIGNEYYRGMAFSKVVQCLCKDCYERVNPHLNAPGLLGYRRRYYTVKFLMWAILIAILIGGFLLIRGRFRLLF